MVVNLDLVLHINIRLLASVFSIKFLDGRDAHPTQKKTPRMGVPPVLGIFARGLLKKPSFSPVLNANIQGLCKNLVSAQSLYLKETGFFPVLNG